MASLAESLESLFLETRPQPGLVQKVSLLADVVLRIASKEFASLLEVLPRVIALSMQAQKPRRVTASMENLDTDLEAKRETALQELSSVLSSLSDQDALTVTKIFSLFLDVVNIAEQRHRELQHTIHSTISAVDKSSYDMKECITELVSQEGCCISDVLEALKRICVEFVLTAHPTQATRRTILHKHTLIYHALAKLELPSSLLSEDERFDLLMTIEREILSLVHTDPIRRKAPDPVDEARSGLKTIETTLWQAVPRVLKTVDFALMNAQKKEASSVMSQDDLLSPHCPLFRISSWVGGDRDGNPYVTARVTLEVLLHSRLRGLKLFMGEIEQLLFDLSIKNVSPEFSAKAEAAVKALKVPLFHPSFAEFFNYVPQNEDIRLYFAVMRARLFHSIQRTEQRLSIISDPTFTIADSLPHEMTFDPSTDEYINSEIFMQQLLDVYEVLCVHGYTSVARGHLTDTIRRLRVFGLGLARVDIRQDASVHLQAMDAITAFLGWGRFSEWDEKRKVECLVRELSSHRPLIAWEDVERFEVSVREVLYTFRVLALFAECKDEHISSYIISMAMAPSDVLLVLLFQKIARISSAIRIVPLFETLEALSQSEATMRSLLAIPEYRSFIDKVGFQEIMLGYSDSAKDAGRLAADWALYNCQEALMNVCKEAGVRFVFFHGRGGSQARGGGAQHLAVFSQPPGSVGDHLRLTIQGETIFAYFGTPRTCSYTLESYLTGVLKATLRPPPPPSESGRALLNDLSAISATAFRAVRDDDQFPEYFGAVTPLQYLGALNIGSRPTVRRQPKISTTTGTFVPDISVLRAIPWVFSWTQVHFHLPVWLGADEAFQQALDSGKLNELRMLYREWPFFRTMIDLLQMVLLKTDAIILQMYQRVLLKPEAAELQKFGSELVNRLARMESIVSLITSAERGSMHTSTLYSSWIIRSAFLFPLNVLQARAMSALRTDSQRKLAEDIVLVTIKGVASGMRNTG